MNNLSRNNITPKLNALNFDSYLTKYSKENNLFMANILKNSNQEFRITKENMKFSDKRVISNINSTINNSNNRKVNNHRYSLSYTPNSFDVENFYSKYNNIFNKINKINQSFYNESFGNNKNNNNKNNSVDFNIYSGKVSSFFENIILFITNSIKLNDNCNIVRKIIRDYSMEVFSTMNTKECTEEYIKIRSQFFKSNNICNNNNNNNDKNDKNHNNSDTINNLSFDEKEDNKMKNNNSKQQNMSKNDNSSSSICSEESDNINNITINKEDTNHQNKDIKNIKLKEEEKNNFNTSNIYRIYMDVEDERYLRNSITCIDLYGIVKMSLCKAKIIVDKWLLSHNIKCVYYKLYKMPSKSNFKYFNNSKISLLPYFIFLCEKNKLKFMLSIEISEYNGTLEFFKIKESNKEKFVNVSLTDNAKEAIYNKDLNKSVQNNHFKGITTKEDKIVKENNLEIKLNKKFIDLKYVKCGINNKEALNSAYIVKKSRGSKKSSFPNTPSSVVKLNSPNNKKNLKIFSLHNSKNTNNNNDCINKNKNNKSIEKQDYTFIRKLEKNEDSYVYSFFYLFSGDYQTFQDLMKSLVKTLNHPCIQRPTIFTEEYLKTQIKQKNKSLVYF